MSGALLYVFSKSAKFSLFKPAEEMVYISMDEEGRTKVWRLTTRSFMRTKP